MHILAAAGAAICKVEMFSWQISDSHICTEAAAPVGALGREDNFESLSENVYARTRTQFQFHVSLWE